MKVTRFDLKIVITMVLTFISGACFGEYAGQSDYEDDEINQLLVYPMARSNVLEYPDLRNYSKFMIGYSADIDSNHLVVELDGKNITHLFNPKPNSIETIELPIVVNITKKLTLRIPQLLEESSAETVLWDYDEFEIKAETGQSLFLGPPDFDMSKYPSRKI